MLLAEPRYVRWRIGDEDGVHYFTIELQVYIDDEAKAFLASRAEEKRQRRAAADDAAIARAKAAQEARDRRAAFIASIPKRLAAAWRSLGRTGQLIARLTLILAAAAAAGVWAILRATS